jgi:hypothetical protein
MQTAAIDTAKGITYVDATLLADITAHYNAYHAAYTAVESALSKRVGETAESVAALETLKLFIRHMA